MSLLPDRVLKGLFRVPNKKIEIFYFNRKNLYDIDMSVCFILWSVSRRCMTGTLVGCIKLYIGSNVKENPQGLT